VAFFCFKDMFDLLYEYFRARTDIDELTFQQITPYFRSLRAKKNEILLNKGERSKCYYFVNKGCIRLFTINEDGQDATLYFAFEGAFGGALPSLIQNLPAFEFVQAVEPSQLLVISRNDFFYLTDTVPAVAKAYRLILETAFVTAQKRIYGLQQQNALEKLRWLLDYQPSILSRLSSKMIASFIGVTPYTLSCLKSQL
jgi:CRP-like cAMP-binding protein